MNFILGILLVYGICNIIVQGSILYSFKEYLLKNKWLKIHKLLNCPMCIGFWIGAIIGCFIGPFIWFNIIFNGFIYSGTTWIIFCIMQFFGQGYDPSRTINVLFPDSLKIINNKEENQSSPK